MSDHPESERRSPSGGGVSVHIQFDVRGGPPLAEVCGSLESDAHARRPFHGWLGLLGELERMVTDTAGEDEQP